MISAWRAVCQVIFLRATNRHGGQLLVARESAQELVIALLGRPSRVLGHQGLKGLDRRVNALAEGRDFILVDIWRAGAKREADNEERRA